ncbi:glutathione S-transferase family protein [Cedecea davisae]|uniref:glutathione S-transferase family protein n=1 Tax=Cedecea davisae TaxID=158484 RepID=UPI00376EB350
MGQLIDGVWHDVWYDTKSTGGRFKRTESAFRNWLTADGTAGPDGSKGFAAEKDRYHLYVSLACPWAHRTLMVRKLKGLEPFISVSVVHPLMLQNGWTFGTDFPDATGDTLYQHDFLYQLYLQADPNYTGRVTVPVLWDKKNQTIVSNESAEIIRMFNTAFDALGARAGDYYPEALRSEIDELNGWIYDSVNNGVYKAGFATSQEAYDEAVDKLFISLERLEQILGQHRYLTGNQLTEADIRLWTTLVRFDPVYVTHFKCDKRRISDYPNLYGFLRDIYQLPGISETVSFPHIRNHYYRSHKTINPTGVISVGPAQDLDQPHGRDVRFSRG